MKVLVKYGAQVDLPVRCDVQKWIQDCVILFGQTGQLVQLGWEVFDKEWEGHKSHPFLHVPRVCFFNF